ncbi:MAG TPA: type II secretion system F family protein [Acidimicrobiales bacterium]|nr:type II secretion system F family protein [Acidimicrobiales bacterium]
MIAAAIAVAIVILAVALDCARRATVLEAARRRSTGAAPALRVRWAGWLGRRRQHRTFADALPVVLEDVARAVRSGSTLRHACAEAASTGTDPLRTELAAVVERAERGQPLGGAVVDWSRQHASPDVRLAGAALALAAAAGGSPARAVDGAAATLRERRAVAGEVRAHSAQARLSAIVIGVLPLAFLTWALAADGRTAAFLVADPIGWACLVAGVVLEVLGALWMRRIVREASP